MNALNEKMDATSIITAWQTRLVKLANRRPHARGDTSPGCAEDHHRPLAMFAGYSEISVAEFERSLGTKLPSLFRAYLLRMAKSPGPLFCGSSLAGPASFEEFRADALVLLAENAAELALPADAIVFLFHQGYSFCYLLASGGVDGSVWQWTEGDAAFSQITESFAQFVDAEISSMELSDYELHAPPPDTAF